MIVSSTRLLLACWLPLPCLRIPPTLNPKPPTLDPAPETVNPKPSTYEKQVSGRVRCRGGGGSPRTRSWSCGPPGQPEGSLRLPRMGQRYVFRV